jgi:hypothetical protein
MELFFIPRCFSLSLIFSRLVNNMRFGTHFYFILFYLKKHLRVYSSSAFNYVESDWKCCFPMNRQARGANYVFFSFLTSAVERACPRK